MQSSRDAKNEQEQEGGRKNPNPPAHACESAQPEANTHKPENPTNPLTNSSLPNRTGFTFAPMYVPEPGRSADTEVVQGSATTSSTLGTVIRWMRESSPVAFWVTVATSIATSVAALGATFYTSKVTSGLQQLSNGNKDAFSMTLAAAGIAAVCDLMRGANSILYGAFKTIFDVRVFEKIRDKTLQAANLFTPAEQQKPEIAKEINRLNQGRYSARSLADGIFQVVTAVSGAVAATCGMILSSQTLPPLEIYGMKLSGLFLIPVVLSFIPLYFYEARRHGKELAAAHERTNEAFGKFSHFDVCSIGTPMAKEIRSAGKTQEAREHLREEKEKIDQAILDPHTRSNLRAGLITLGNTITIGVIGVTTLIHLAVDLVNAARPANIDIGVYALMIGSLGIMNQSCRGLSAALGQIQQHLPIVKIVQDVLNRVKGRTEPDVREIPEEILEQARKAQSISITNLTFTYPPSNQDTPRIILHDISLEIAAGEMIGVVGPSGCGKTTLLKVISGQVVVGNEELLLDGTCINSLTETERALRIGYAAQSVANMVGKTLRENILLGARKALTDEELAEALEKSGFALDMHENKWTLDTVLGAWYKNGTGLSGGQETRLALTRAIVSDAGIIIGDEITANQDNARTYELIKTIHSMRKKTWIIVAHDIGVANNCDKILVMDQGRIVDFGTPRELAKRCSQYRAIMRTGLQMSMHGIDPEDIEGILSEGGKVDDERSRVD